jgi:hypothetical protein
LGLFWHRLLLETPPLKPVMLNLYNLATSGIISQYNNNDLLNNYTIFVNKDVITSATIFRS